MGSSENTRKLLNIRNRWNGVVSSSGVASSPGHPISFARNWTTKGAYNKRVEGLPKPRAAVCPLCGADDPRTLYRSEQPLLRFVRCARCGMMYQSPRIAESEMDDAYQALEEYGHYAELETKKRELFAWKIGGHVRGRKLPPNGAFLDIGTSYGVMLDALRMALPGWSLAAVEISPSARASLTARGYTVAESLESLDPAMKFDWINLDNVLEHMPDPLDVLQGLRKRLKPGGFVYIDVPNESFFFLRYRINDLMRGFPKPPTFPGHVNLFTPRTLKKLIAAAGYCRERFWLESVSSSCRLEGGLGAVETPRLRALLRFLRFTRLDIALGFAYFLCARIEPADPLP